MECRVAENTEEAKNWQQNANQFASEQAKIRATLEEIRSTWEKKENPEQLINRAEEELAAFKQFIQTTQKYTAASLHPTEYKHINTQITEMIKTQRYYEKWLFESTLLWNINNK
jgi:hypothetical protein